MSDSRHPDPNAAPPTDPGAPPPVRMVVDGLPPKRPLGRRALRWGIVTNKATRFTDRIVETLGLTPDCVVCGDTTPRLKPHPDSLLHAAGDLGLPPGECLYLGDDLRDVQAALAAGMRAVAVGWGYHHPESGGPRSWKAEAVIAQPADLIALL